MWLLHGLGADNAGLDVEVAAVILNRVRTPDGFQGLDRLLTDPAALTERDVVHIAFVFGPSQADAEGDAAVAQLVHGRNPPAEHDRVVKRDIDDADAQPDPRRDGGGIGQGRHVLENRVVLRVQLAIGRSWIWRLGVDRHQHSLVRPQRLVIERLGLLGGFADVVLRRNRADVGQRESKLHLTGSLFKLQREGLQAAQNLAHRFQAPIIRGRHDRSGKRVAMPPLQRQGSQNAASAGHAHGLFGDPDADLCGEILRLVNGDGGCRGIAGHHHPGGLAQ